MTVKEITEQLKNLTDENIKTWYAVHADSEDQDDGVGSNDPEEAAKMALKMGCYEIALIYDGTDETYDTLDLPETYAVYLDNEECSAYGRFEAYDLNDAVKNAIDIMIDATEEPGWTFRQDEKELAKINMYYHDEWQNEVSVWPVED